MKETSRLLPFLPDISAFFRFFLIFPSFWQIFAVRGGTLPPLPPQWLRHWWPLTPLNVVNLHMN